MKKIVYVLSALVIAGCSTSEKTVNTTSNYKKSEPVVFSYGADSVYQSEFERVYSKNNKDSVPDNKAVREYLDLYINFKLKVKEAYALHLDTLESFRSELEGYRKQLAQPYLVDKKVTDDLVNEAYERMQYEINASHILINCVPEASPADTAEAYKKAFDLRNRALNGTPFDSLAVRYSDDPSAINSFGNLGYFTVFQMIYPFETGAYNTPVGQLSMPVRTRFGYHIIKVNDKRPNRGEVKVAHIMIRVQTNNTTEEIADLGRKAEDIYDKLKKGGNFAELAKQYSDDFPTRNNGGELNWFSGTSNYPTEFKDAAFALKEKGEISQPVQTAYGFHIMKLIDKRPVPSREQLTETLKQRVARDSRSELNRTAVIERIKKENDFKSDEKALKSFINSLDSSLVNGTFSAASLRSKPVVLFNIGEEKYTTSDFAAYLEKNQVPRKNANAESVVRSMYADYINATALDYEERHLDTKYEAFRNLMQEYKDGILLFTLTDQKVWSKSVTDTAGLENYYSQHKQDYQWKERASAVIYECSSEQVATKVWNNLSAKKPLSDSALVKSINKSNTLNLTVRSDKFEQGEDEILSMVNWAPGKYKVVKNDRVYVVVIRQIIPPETKPLSEIRGLVTSDYQAYLEKAWLTELKAKYPVQVYEENVKKLFKQ